MYNGLWAIFSIIIPVIFVTYGGHFKGLPLVFMLIALCISILFYITAFYDATRLSGSRKFNCYSIGNSSAIATDEKILQCVVVATIGATKYIVLDQLLCGCLGTKLSAENVNTDNKRDENSGPRVGLRTLIPIMKGMEIWDMEVGRIQEMKLPRPKLVRIV